MDRENREETNMEEELNSQDGSPDTAKEDSPEPDPAEQQASRSGDAAEEASADTGEESDAREGQEQNEAKGAPGAEEEPEDGKFHVFGKKKQKKDAKDIQIEELTDRLRRNMAEFDNFRKRTEKEKSAMFEIGARDIIERILPVIDNFERGLAAVPEDVKGTPFADGMEMIYKQLLKNLEDAGVRAIKAEGEPFDPNFHNAVMHVEDENLGENVVAQELQKGYMYRDSVVRHSMVSVAN